MIQLIDYILKNLKKFFGFQEQLKLVNTMQTELYIILYPMMKHVKNLVHMGIEGATSFNHPIYEQCYNAIMQQGKPLFLVSYVFITVAKTFFWTETRNKNK